MSNNIPFVYNMDTGEPLVAQRIGDAGVDFSYEGAEPLVLRAGEIALASTRTKLNNAGCHDFVLDVRSRSGMALKGIVVANSPGTVDSGFEGEIQVILQNFSGSGYVIEKGDRIAQGVFTPIIPPRTLGVVRGEGGFGSSGTKR